MPSCLIISMPHSVVLVTHDEVYVFFVGFGTVCRLASRNTANGFIKMWAFAPSWIDRLRMLNIVLLLFRTSALSQALSAAAPDAFRCMISAVADYSSVCGCFPSLLCQLLICFILFMPRFVFLQIHRIQYIYIFCLHLYQTFTPSQQSNDRATVILCNVTL